MDDVGNEPDRLPVHPAEAPVQLFRPFVRLLPFLVHQDGLRVLLDEAGGQMDFTFVQLDGVSVQLIPERNGLIPAEIYIYDGPCHFNTEDDMGNQSLGETLAGSALMVAGLKANIDKLKRRGLDEGFVSSIEGLNDTIGDLNAEQEALKSRLKEKTAQVDEAVVSLKAKLSEARKVIKLELPQTGWKEYGITDVR